MSQSSNQINIYLELGKKRVFAGAVDWPGWCRSGRDEGSALQSLLHYAPRYAEVLQNASLDFQPPAGVSAFTVVERLEGSTTTDFGAPDAVPDADSRPVEAEDLQRFQELLEASWQAFDAATDKAAGRPLRKGPRGGKRWLPRYYIRRAIWHTLDHVWEIEDRLQTDDR